ncbi:MAG: CgeB family protein [Oscillochloridaceae bacterium umkhey_bin13]
MNIYICYARDSLTTGNYFEIALKRQGHQVFYIGPAFANNVGYQSNIDLYALSNSGYLPSPDFVLFIESPASYFPRGLEKISCPTACYIIDIHLGTRLKLQFLPFFDYVFCAQKDYIPLLQRHHQQVSWLPLACDPVIHGKQSLSKTSEVGFVGNSYASVRRSALLSAIEKEFSINDYHKMYAKELLSTVYSQAKIVFNCSINGDVNMRVFEALASGTLLLTDRVENGLYDLFDEGVHLITYENENEMLQCIRYFLDHEHERELIALEGMHHVLEKHTYEHRVLSMLETIFQSSARKVAPIRQFDQENVIATYAGIYAMYRVVDPVIDQLDVAWKCKSGRLRVLLKVIIVLSRRFNAIFRITPSLRELASVLGYRFSKKKKL